MALLSRRKLRENIFRLLFLSDYHEASEIEEQMELFFFIYLNTEEDSCQYISKRFEQITQHLPEIDESISEASKGWRLPRIGKCELAILRLALFEMRYDTDIPVKVAINEAVELSKIYCSEEAPRFVNGILGKLAESDSESAIR